MSDHDAATTPPAAPATPATPADGSRRSRLLTIQLRSLVSDHLGESVSSDASPEVADFPPGAGLVLGTEAWVLVDDRPAHRLGGALAWALRRGATALHVVTEQHDGLLARRAGEFAFPISVWRADGRSLRPAEPAAPLAPVAADPAHLALRELIAAGGATPVVEHGVVSGEVRGLEVCRVVGIPAHEREYASGPGAEHGARLEIGVGEHDREAFQMLHGHTPVVESLSRVVDAVREHRVPGAARHPFNRMAPERLLRWRIEDDPSLVELVSVTPAEPPVPRISAVEAVPCVAHGTDRDGRRVVVVCSSGVDLDVVPYAADARLTAAAAAARPGVVGPGDGLMPVDRVVVVTPARDRLAITAEVAALLDQSVELASID